jgi:FdhE protein
MRQTLKHQERLFDVDEALEEIKARRPAMTDIATSYALLQKARLAAATALPLPSLLHGQPATAELAQGRPFLAELLESLGSPSPELVTRFRAAAKLILPQAAQAFPKLAQDMARLALLLDSAGTGQDEGAGLAAALLAGIAPGADSPPEGQSIEDIAARLHLVPAALHMTATESLLAVLANESARLAPLVEQDAWRRGYCPVCGGGPDVGFLKEAKEDSEFLIAKAGQLWFHCGQCTALWRFPRLRCAACDCEDSARLEILIAEGDTRAEMERAHLCLDCRTYFNTVNLVDRTDRINLEMLPMSLLHLDVLAQERGFAPVAPSPWNTLT